MHPIDAFANWTAIAIVVALTATLTASQRHPSAKFQDPPHNCEQAIAFQRYFDGVTPAPSIPLETINEKGQL